MSKNKKTIFSGAATALITPFKNGKIDFDAFGRLIDRQLEASIDAIVVAGTTGEAPTLSLEEIALLTRFAVDRTNKKVPIIVGTGSNDISKAIRMTKAADAEGADAFLAVTPYYNKASQKGLIESYIQIASCTSKPIIVYNVPTRTCVDISLDTYEELSKIENIVAVKEASSDIVKYAELVCRCGDNLDIYTGNDNEILPALSVGGAGTISVVSNLIPEQVHNICRMYFGGNTADSRKLFCEYLPLMKAMFFETNPIPVKTALFVLGLCREEFRLPLCSMEKETRGRLEKVLKEYFVNDYPAKG